MNLLEGVVRVFMSLDDPEIKHARIGDFLQVDGQIYQLTENANPANPGQIGWQAMADLGVRQ